MLHVPILRAGQPYHSKDLLVLHDYATGEPVAEVSQANSGLISRDLSGIARPKLADLPISDILHRMRRAAELFMQAELPVGDAAQSADEFVAAQSATTGLPYVLCRQNMNKIEAAMRNMAGILDGLSGGLDLSVLDTGYGSRDGHTVSFVPRTRRFGAVLPANSPGVHALWLPAVALKMAVALKPGQREPWTPLRILEAFRAAGIPDSDFGFYPCGHDGAGVILRKCGAAMMFGAGPTVRPWLADPRVEIHGPGNSKVLLGPDKAESFQQHLEVIVTSVAANGGRSCINASSIRTTSHADELADVLAQRLAQIVPRPRHHDQALLSAFAEPSMAEGINAAIRRDLDAGGAEDITARYRDGERLVRFEGGTYLLPTVIRCQTADHPLANREYLFPFVSVVEVATEDLVNTMGPTLVATALTGDARLEAELLVRSDIGRLNLGPVPTTVLEWDQPHEGNLFEHLYQQRAFQREAFAAAM